MTKYITLKNTNFEILVPETLKTYGEEVLKYSSKKLKEYLLFFKEKPKNIKIKGSFLTNHSDFINRIKEVSGPNVQLPPAWATGCFYGGEIQILLDENKPYEKFTTLAHETFHILFSKFIYEKYNISRIVWLDEALASSFDGTTEKLIKNNTFKDIVNKLINNEKLPKLNNLSFAKGNIVSDEYNGYDLFKVVGRYLIETKSNLLSYIKNEEQILNDGETLLDESINYFKSKYNLSKNYYWFYKPPKSLDDLIMNSDGTSLTRLCFINSKDEKKCSLNGIKEFLPIFKETSAWLDIYFKGQIPNFTPKYKIDNLTLFRQEVIDIMNTIPYGKTITYNAIAKSIAQKRNISKMSSQAVGGAVGWNPICIIIPCHRVVGANGNLTGYGGGLNNKIELLKIENNNMQDFHLPKI